MRLFALVSILIISFSARSQDPSIDDFKLRHSCPLAETTIDNEDIPAFLKSNRIKMKTEIDHAFVARFLNEYKKFPNNLRLKMIEVGAVIHLIQGNGVSDDPTWNGGKKTFDGRPWSDVPGGGGIPELKKKFPTRIVVNHLYDRHGSSNLFLHEHAHSLDRIRMDSPISSSIDWKEVTQTQDVQKFLKVICGTYCVENANEGFAELFAYYHACTATKKDVEMYLPEVAKYISNLADSI